MIAALYVETGGVYYGLPDVDPWDEERDARGYQGPHPVVAHPPCQLWVNMAGVNFKRYGGPHNRPGNDNGCFARALECVREFGGVLEHPAGSYAWSTFALARPEGRGWTRVGMHEWVCEAWQSAYGHRARKAHVAALPRRVPPARGGHRPAGWREVHLMSTASRLNGQGGELCEACVKIIGRMLPPPHNDQGTP